MAVHMVRVFCEPPKGEADNAVQNWVDNHEEWQGDPVEHELVERSVTTADGTEAAFLVGNWRFVDNGEDATQVIDSLSQRLQSVQGGLWHRLLYHRCTHDEDTPESCSWGTKKEWGDVPAAVPDPF